MKKILLTAAVLCSVNFLAAESLVERTDHQISPYWNTKPLRGKNFRTCLNIRGIEWGKGWHGILLPGVFRSEDQDHQLIRNLSGLPMFRDADIAIGPIRQTHGNLFRLNEIDKFNKGGEVTVSGIVEPDAEKCFSKLDRNGRMVSFNWWDARPFAFKVRRESYRADKAGFEQWLKAHPEFACFSVEEWDNEMICLEWYLSNYLKRKLISPELAKEVQKDFPVAYTKDEFIGRMNRIFCRLRSFYFEHPERLSFLHCGWNVGHLAADWGAGMIGLETSNSGNRKNYHRWQTGMSFIRGASRQYGVPWRWYIARYFNGWTSKGKWVNNCASSLDSDRGVGCSWLDRCFYLAYFSGAGQVEVEHWYNAMLAKVPGKPGAFQLSRIGKKYQDFYTFTKKYPERGIAYTPIALLVPYNQGYPQWGGNAWSRCSYTRGDFMLDAFWATILPAHDHEKALRNGEQGALFNSPYGDLFDVVNPDTPVGSKAIADYLNAYKVANLLGDIRLDSAVVKRLTDYVRNGGTLVLNVKQLTSLFPTEFAGIKRSGRNYSLKEYPGYEAESVTLSGAKVLEKSKDGVPLLTANRYGKGKVILSCVDSWVPALTAKSSEDTQQGRIHFPLIRDLLGRLTAETIPFRISGNIQYGLNRTKSGWLIYLINNRGVTKMADTAEVFDPGAAASVEICGNGCSVKNAMELRTDSRLSVSDNKIKMTVPAGDVRVLEIKLAE